MHGSFPLHLRVHCQAISDCLIPCTTCSNQCTQRLGQHEQLTLFPAGFEARGFIFGAPLALALKCAFVPFRKPGKLPGMSLTHIMGYPLAHILKLYQHTVATSISLPTCDVLQMPCPHE